MSLPKVLVTGAPGIGKTTLIKSFTERIRGVKLAGIVTEEVRDKKGRTGFTVRTLDGQKEAMFATSGGKGKKGKRVGKYHVDVDAFEQVALDAVAYHPEYNLYVIDEIGPMECLSRTFCETVKMLIKSDRVAVLASVAKGGHPFIRDIIRMPGTEVVELTGSGHERIEDELLVKFMTALVKPGEG
ncbi:MAG: nucleoside triphosphatase [Deltaproteobacteria bacterium]|nr:MAG: nucleoside triphosphatase [Deltaproteobacteria bacterium]